MKSDQEKEKKKGDPPLELHTQIRKYRTTLNLSQEELAEKVYVTRQTISNWENNKNYPDIQTFKEIVSFTEGKRLDEIQKAQEFGKRPYQKVISAFACGLIAFVVCILFIWLLKSFIF